ncbi:Alpha/Beta hydrolase protein [Dactylonectria estremocensis]|uniref:Alpha/Beta hydrolase protein n=1 Tax=Dactylonectria estremocensis TaxID=1079267 RepID=A0A9P9DD54_9HYPO|nr:Alpha/Beta hydrolase protein [Dactylonectria estremocensis]KAH7116636.1 Alpha/Beta hydrolase protein [Dactylonectria estremocensis]
MPTFKSPVDGTSLYYRYYEPLTCASDPVQPLTLVFLHGWPMSSRMWDHFFIPLVQAHRFHVLAPDRRGFGNSDWNAGPTSRTLVSGSAVDSSTPRTTAVSWQTLTDDLTALLTALDIGPFAFVAASMGCPESVLTYLSSAYVRANCRAFVWIGPNMPYNIRSDACPAAPLSEVWDFLSAGLSGPVAKAFAAEQLTSVFRVDLAGNELEERVLRFYERLVCQADPVALVRMPEIFRDDLVAELTRFAESTGAEKMPIMVLHGGADTGMPLEASGRVIKEMLPWADLRVYENAGHGLYLTHADRVLKDIIEIVARKPGESSVDEITGK